MDIKKLEIYHCKPVHADFTLDKEENPCIVETAGFVPLEVKFKQFEQNGLRVQFTEDEFTSSDLRDIYLNPDLQVYPGDDLIDIEQKLAAQQALAADILKKRHEEFEKSEALASDSRGGEPRNNDEKSSSQENEDSKK